MDFGLNETQQMLQQSARDFLSAEYPEKLLRAMIKDEKGYTPELWAKITGLGWTGLSLPEAYGGFGDFFDLTVVLHEMGMVCFISPYFATLVLGAAAIAEAGNETQKKRFLPDIAAGKTIVTLALLEKSAQYAAPAIQMRAIEEKEAYLLHGTKLFVPHAQSADYLILAARTGQTADPEHGVTLFIVDRRAPGISCESMSTVDGDKLCQVTCAGVKADKEAILGEPHRGWTYLQKIIAGAAVGRCAESVGACAKVLEITLNYAKERIAFGHPIGAFQSIQHRCADMLFDLEGSRLATHKAAWALSAGLPALKEAAVAKAWVSQASRRIVTSAHQVHGAIGFTEDHILHLYTKRVRANEFSFGDADHHLNEVAAMTTAVEL
jgi:alkylation response protein AidB-like acyl-CoA dehydrogenase